MRLGSLKYMLIIILTGIFTMPGCKRIPLYEPSSRVLLKIEHDLDIDHEIKFSSETALGKDYTKKIEGVMPEYVEVLIYDHQTHRLLSSHILNAEGGHINIPSGNYDMVVYSFGTESTQVGYLGHKLEAEAYTTDITKHMASKLFGMEVKYDGTKSGSKSYESDPIIHEPDHLYVANENGIFIPAVQDLDEPAVIHLTSDSIVEVYSLEVQNIKGAENVEKVEAFITGQIRSNYFGKEEHSPDAATVYTDMTVDATGNRFYSVFGTFGKQPGHDNNIYLDVTVTDSSGGQYRYIFDVTDQFDDLDNTNHTLTIDAGGVIDIPDAAHGGSGLDPSVDPWENEEIDIPLG